MEDASRPHSTVKNAIEWGAQSCVGYPCEGETPSHPSKPQSGSPGTPTSRQPAGRRRYKSAGASLRRTAEDACTPSRQNRVRAAVPAWSLPTSMGGGARHSTRIHGKTGRGSRKHFRPTYDVCMSRQTSAESRKKPRPSVNGIAPNEAATQASGSTRPISEKVIT